MKVFVAALGLPAGIYNVFPGQLVRLGGKKSEIMTRSQRVSNAAIKAASDWAPRYPSAREGWESIVHA